MYVKFTRKDGTDVYSGTIKYEVGKIAKAPDWHSAPICGGGLHFGKPAVALVNLLGIPHRVFKVKSVTKKVKIEPGKFKAQKLVPLKELNIKKILYELARNESYKVRAAAAKNPNTPPEILSKLAKDEKVLVRGSAAENPNTPSKILSELAKDGSDLVRARAAENRHTPSESLSKLTEDSDFIVLWRIAENSNTPPEALSRLAEKEDASLQQLVVENPSTSQETLSRLTKDINAFTQIRTIALEKLRERGELRQE